MASSPVASWSRAPVAAIACRGAPVASSGRNFGRCPVDRSRSQAPRSQPWSERPRAPRPRQVIVGKHHG
eukprot:1676843-Alexandrium_andersonii.AAC.1